jgi:hypothetical protein
MSTTSLASRVLVLALVGCTTTTPDTPHLNFASDTYTLQPGEEKYFCYTTNLPADRDIAITKLTPTYGLGTHHILFTQTTVAEPAFSECPVLTRSTWVTLYAGGVESGSLEMPPQIGLMPLERGQQVLMQLHLQNSGDAPVSARAAMRIDYVDATPEIMPSGLFGLDNRKLVIPPHTESAMNEMSCEVDADLDVFAVLGHMHKNGVHLDLSRGATAGEDMLYEEKWNFDAQPITRLDLDVKKGDNLFLRCTHRNTTDLPLGYGESSDTEMCAAVLYYAPAGPARGCVVR